MAFAPWCFLAFFSEKYFAEFQFAEFRFAAKCCARLALEGNPN